MGKGVVRVVQKDGFLTIYNMNKKADREKYKEDMQYKEMERILDDFVSKVVEHKLLNYDVMFKKLKKIFRSTNDN